MCLFNKEKLTSDLELNSVSMVFGFLISAWIWEQMSKKFLNLSLIRKGNIYNISKE
jgi:hypothetical protein